MTFHMFEHRMNFEAEQRAKESNEHLNALIAQKLEDLGEPWSIDKMVTAVNWASEQQNPDHGELRYELDENA